MKNRWVLLLFIFLMIGCAPDSRELDHRSVIMGVAVDEGENERFSVSIQLPILTEGGEGGLSPQAREFEIFTTEANTLWDALADLEAITPSVLFFGHLKAVLVSEQLAKEDLPLILDLFGRESTVGNQVFLIVVDGSAKEFIVKESPLVNLPSLYLERYFRAEQKLSRSRGVMLFEYRRDSNMISRAATLPLAKLKDEQIAIEGMAVFKDHQLVEKLKPTEVGFSELLKNNQIDFMNYTVTMDEENEEFISLSRINLKQDVEIKRTKPVHFSIRIQGNGEILSANDINRNVDTSLIQKVEEEVSKQFTEQLEDLIKKMQLANAEPWLLGHRIWANHPEYFSQLKWNEKGWQEATFDIKVDFEVDNTGQRGFINKQKLGR